MRCRLAVRKPSEILVESYRPMIVDVDGQLGPDVPSGSEAVRKRQHQLPTDTTPPTVGLHSEVADFGD
jgi:hypothetical protein